MGKIHLPFCLGSGIQRTVSSPSKVMHWLYIACCWSPLLALLALVVGSGYIPWSGGAHLISSLDGSTEYRGYCKGSVCSWLGVRYASPPIGNLRFAPPKAASSPENVQMAIELGNRCPQSGSIDQQDEDCLFLNIQRPRQPSLDTKLPVLVFFHGGGFESGSGNDNDPKALIEVGYKNNQSVVIVRINYRLGLFGFLASQELEDARDDDPDNVGLNRGFQDMKMATEWVKENIDSFGGDAERITIWGQSAGSFGASAQMLGHPTTAPFRAAILQSGSPGGVPIDQPSVKNAQYQRVLVAAQCNSSSDHLSCLRSLSWQDLRTISLAESARAMQPATYTRGFFAWTSVIDGGPTKGGFLSSTPSVVINTGAFARVPVLQGDCLDEGTLFAPHNLNDTEALSDWLTSVYFLNPLANSTTNASSTLALDHVLMAYPDEPTIGSPYDVVGTTTEDRFFGSTNQFKRAASIYGDIRYQSNRRLWLAGLTSKNVTAYSYLYAQSSSHASPSLGVPHGSDLQALLQSPSNPVSKTMARQFLSFAVSLDPGATSGVPVWPVYSSNTPTMLQYQNGSIAQINDDFRSQSIDVLNTETILQITGR